MSFLKYDLICCYKNNGNVKKSHELFIWFFFNVSLYVKKQYNLCLLIIDTTFYLFVQSLLSMKCKLHAVTTIIIHLACFGTLFGLIQHESQIICRQKIKLKCQVLSNYASY